MTHLDELISLSVNNQSNIVKTGRGTLRQVAIVVSVEEKEKCLEMLSKLVKDGVKWILPHPDGVLNVQLASNEIATKVRICRTKVYETRIAKLDEPDPRKIAMAKKRIRDSREGRLSGTPTILLEEKLKEVLRTSLRATVEKIIRKQLNGAEQRSALTVLAGVEQVVISNVETAPTRLRMSWKDASGKNQSKALSSGVTIIFETPSNSREGWLKDFVKTAKEQGAWVDGIFFPQTDSSLI